MTETGKTFCFPGLLLLPVILGICQLVLMDIDATHINVGGIFYAKRQSILKKKNF